jgi:hypothetical protein
MGMKSQNKKVAKVVAGRKHKYELPIRNTNILILARIGSKMHMKLKDNKF